MYRNGPSSVFQKSSVGGIFLPKLYTDSFMYFSDQGNHLWSSAGNWFRDAGFFTPAGRAPVNHDFVFVAAATFTDNIPVLSLTGYEGAIPGVGGVATQSTNLTISAKGNHTNPVGILEINSGFFGGHTQLGVQVSFDTNGNNGGTIAGDASFIDNATNDQGTVGGNATFSGSAINQNGSTITGNAYFTDSSYNEGIVHGDCSLDADAQNHLSGHVFGNMTNTSGRNFGTVDGNLDSGNGNDGNVGGSGSITAGYNNGSITGAGVFSGSSVHAAGATVGSDAYFYDTSSQNGGSIGGSANFYNSSQSLQGAVSDPVFWDVSSNSNGSDNGLSGTGTFRNGSTNNGGGGPFNKFMYDNSQNYGGGYSAFHDSSQNHCGFAPNCDFYDSSENAGDGDVQGTVSFNNFAINTGQCEGSGSFGDYTINNGSCIMGSYSFGGNAMNNGNAGYQADFSANAISNGNLNSSGSFNDNSLNYGTISAGTYTLTFNDGSRNHGNLADPDDTNPIQFFGTAQNSSDGVCNANAEFNNSSQNLGAVGLQATFNDSSSNHGTYGTIVCNTSGTCPGP